MAFDINASLAPIIAGVIEILPLFLDLVIAMVPIVIVLAVSRKSIIDIFRPVGRIFTWVLRQDPWYDQGMSC
jgi:hypothetical protein